MTSKKTRRALFSSVLSLILCCSMLIGTTFAWFTDEVISENNIIKSGTLDVEMYYGDTKDTITNDASEGAIFDYKYWEPGYTQTKYVKIANEGDLAFKFQLNVVPDEPLAADAVDLAKVIDVYMLPVDAKVDREAIANATPVGTLAQLMADTDGAAHGILLPKEGSANVKLLDADKDIAKTGEIAYAITLKMQESAGNEYQNKTIGGKGFKVQLLATQYTWENDSFDNMYDDNADFAPKANVKETGPQLIKTSTHGEILANTTFQFLPTESYEEAQESFYRYYHADFVVYADKDIPADAVILPGYYKAYCDNYNNGEWIGLSSDQVITAGTQIRLVDTLGQLLGGTVTVNYEEICKWGNDNVGFKCGVSDQSKGALAGTTLTVELRLYETTGDPTTSTGPKNEETGDYIVIGTYKYTFDDTTMVGNAEQLASALTGTEKNIDVTLVNDIDLPITSLGTITPGSGEYKLGGDDTENITIDLGGKKLNITTTYWSAIGAKNADAKFTIKNGTMTSSQASGTWNSYDVTFANCDYVIEDVTFDKSIALCNVGKTATLKNVTINETHDYYALWISAEGQTVDIDGLTVNCAGGRGIKIDEQYVSTPAKVTLNIADAKFTTASKAAILVKSAAGADIQASNVDISGVAADTTNAVWVDEDAEAYADLVTVTGATKIVEP